MIIIEIYAIGPHGTSVRREIRLPDEFESLACLEVRMRTVRRPLRRHRCRATAMSSRQFPLDLTSVPSAGDYLQRRRPSWPR